MDYDDNDFQSQNLHLATEGSNNFPPVLRPYALPKFDFDEPVHGSLRFDGLVETEIFLGIESNGDNQWIEDFSHSNSRIQFNSSAAESCPISRHNNVWSEATSSESVEMLLKSVGQEEIVPVQTGNKELDSCDELGCIVKPMELNVKQDNSSQSDVGVISDLQHLRPPHEALDNTRALNDSGGLQSQVDDISQTRENSLSGSRVSNDLTSLTADGYVPVTERRLGTDDAGNDVSGREVDDVVTMSLDDRKEMASNSEMQADCRLLFSGNTIRGGDELSEDLKFRNKAAGDSMNVPDTNSELQEEQHQSIPGLQRDDRIVETDLSGSGSSYFDRTNLSNSEEPVSIMSKHDSGSLENLENADQSGVSIHEVEPKGCVAMQRLEVDDSDGSPLPSTKVVSNTTALLLSKEESETSKGKVDSSTSDGGGCSSLAVISSSADLLGGKHGKSHASSTVMAESTLICRTGSLVEQVDTPVCDQDIPDAGNRSTELPSDSCNMDSVVDQSLIIERGVETMRFDDGGKNKSLGTKSVSDSAAEKKTDNIGGITGCAGHAITGDVLLDHVGIEKSPVPLVGYAYSGKDEGTLGGVSTKEHTSDSKTSNQLRAGLQPALESNEISDSGASGQMLEGDQSLLTFDACKAENHGEAQAVVSKKGSQKNMEVMDVCPVLCDSSERNGEDAESVVEVIDEKKSQNISDTGAGPSALRESAHVADLKDLQENEAVTDTEVTNYGQAAVPITSECGGNHSQRVSVSSAVGRTAGISQNENIMDGEKGFTDVNISNVSSASGDPKKNDTLVDEKSFTFEVNPPADTPKKEDSAKWRPVSLKQTSKTIVDGTPSTSGLDQSNTKAGQELWHGSQKAPEGVIALSGSKRNTERKPRRSSGKATAKETSKKGTTKEPAPVRIERGDKLASVTLNPSVLSQLVQPNEMQRYGHVDSSSLKPFVLAASTTNLPDLSSSTSTSAIFQQPFTDLQQVQLRAQIFVYGSLIQGTVPDEAYMISAFGGPDGGRSIWENAWHSCIERLHGQKSRFTSPETPLQSRSGARVPDQAIKQSAPKNKVLSTPVGRASSKGNQAIVNPLVPFSSPLWSLPTPSSETLQSSGITRTPVMDYQRALSPLHPLQSPPIRSFTGHNPSWMSQALFCAPWVASPQTAAFDASGRFPVQLPITETVQLTPIKESSFPHSSGIKHIFSGPVVQTGASGMFSGVSLPDLQKMTASSDQPSADSKTRKRKKASVCGTPGQNILNPLPQTEAVSVSAVASHVSTSVTTITPLSFVSKAPPEKVVTSAPSSTADLSKVDERTDRTVLSDETLSKVNEARLKAEDAAAFAAAAVGHSQEIWNKLEKQRKIGLLPDIESKLASSAVAVAAAAAVAKAAAAVANVASNAALQAKLMADEAVVSSSYGNHDQRSAVPISDCVNNMGKATPSILEEDDAANNSSSILVAARKAARMRVEAASAASKQAENMDAIIKAAELAAEAVSQAGKIVSMGDNLSLDEAVASGSEYYHKVAQLISTTGSKFVDISRENLKTDRSGCPDTSSRHLGEGPSNKKKSESMNYLKFPASRETCEDDVRLVDVMCGGGAATAKDTRSQKGRKDLDLSKTIGVIPESENGLTSSSTLQNEIVKTDLLNGNSIKEGSHVEVFKDGNGFKSAWFSANVLSLKDGMAHVEYDELRTAEGSEKLKEWVSLFSEGDAVPKIRITRPIAAILSEGTRKRRRVAIGDYTWSVGDRVDAWMQDSWWEGIITEKNKTDGTMLTVHFPAQSETSLVRAWHLRSSLMWKDGEWIEWSSLRDSDHAAHLVGDTPQEKRQRVQAAAVEAKGKDKMSKILYAQELDKPSKPTRLDISDDDRIFNIGKGSRDDSKLDTLRMTRTGLQKEGSRVVFGIPKPGKKRKFMEVSKHYVSDRSGKVNEPNDSTKFTKRTRSQASGLQGWNNNSKAESNEKQAVIPKPKVLKSGKLQYGSTRTISSQKDNLSGSQVSVIAEGASADHIAKTKDFVIHVENAAEKHNLVNMQSLSGSEGADGPVMFSSVALQSDTLSSKKVPSLNVKPERISKRKLAPIGGKMGKIEDKVFSSNASNSALDATEPRRSNRRIQPTSRLLEGLQSSLMASKSLSTSHDKSHKNRITSRGNKHD
ncbi:hypothetical protein K2173_012739 [Erythroxylum novogranatense]|uniref:Agenet domain-containing protein n=1 Tax=Erythroxylum novogranatense TaxID=1862640 RepID=A0AAV8SSC2_9ROSI|nr:hypothetical protein K2173_012739 [Erythroxylum novogranatense]